MKRTKSVCFLFSTLFEMFIDLCFDLDTEMETVISPDRTSRDDKGSDRPILIFYNRYRYRYLYVYVTDNRYSEPIFIYCYKVNK